MLRNLGGPEILIILVVVLLLFGASRLPTLARSIGGSLTEFRKGIEAGAADTEDDEKTATESEAGA